MRRGQAVILSAIALFASFTASSAGARSGAQELRRRSFSVIAVVDSGINPYHVDFRRPDLTTHPSRYITGFPNDVPALRLTLDAPNFKTAFERDRDEWRGVAGHDLVWIPGTNIIAARGPLDTSEPQPDFYDRRDHGTAVASLAAGAIHGPGSDDILLVVVPGHSQGVAWAARQSWIDVITNSWIELGVPDTGAPARASRAAVAAGKIVCFASGNNSAPLWALGSQGPSWNVNVGAASAQNRGEHHYSGYPNDVLGLSGMDAATTDSIDEVTGVAGTSIATPAVCGQIARVIAEARARFGDVDEGAHGGGLIVGDDAAGPLEDGVLDRSEIEDAIHATARPAATTASSDDPNSIPALPGAPFIRGGYGIVDRASARDALDVLLGREPRPDRTLEDAWVGFTDLIRDALWGEGP